uniref:Dirigent protein n=1 Tax=Oryza meridionalis TaxID=40149 RepID=A0A0E0CQR9_9ORYZ
MARGLAVMSALLFVLATTTKAYMEGVSRPSALGNSSAPTHLHFYFHDKVTGPSPSAVRVVNPPNNTSPTFFGMVVVMDDPLTEGPDPASKPVGRAQGMYVLSNQARIGFLQAMNIVLTAGPYNGSVITVLGSNHISDIIREMPVLGGTGHFCFAHQKMAKEIVVMSVLLFVLAATTKADMQSGYGPGCSSLCNSSAPTHIHFYFHDKITGPSPSAVQVVSPSNKTSPTSFGTVYVMDDPLTEGHDPRSKPVGRAQGMYLSSDQVRIGFLQAMKIVLTAGPYNGSMITVLGSNHISDSIREMPVVGGTSAFRFARGYVQARTFFLDSNELDAVVEYNVYIKNGKEISSNAYGLVLGATCEGHTHGGPRPSPLGHGSESTHLHFYFHEKVSGPSPSAVMVVNPPDNMSKTLFRKVVVLDDLLTVGPDPRSKPVGRPRACTSRQTKTGSGS